jgi:hypothetical protein
VRKLEFQRQIFSQSVVKTFKNTEKIQPSSEELVTGILSGNRFKSCYYFDRKYKSSSFESEPMPSLSLFTSCKNQFE